MKNLHELSNDKSKPAQTQQVQSGSSSPSNGDHSGKPKQTINKTEIKEFFIRFDKLMKKLDTPVKAKTIIS